MKQFLSNISNTIHQDFVIPLQSQELVFYENKENSKCKKVILKYNNRQAFAFTLDINLMNKCKTFPFFNQSTAFINKVNDGIIFYINNNKIFVFLLELKSNNLGDYKKQLQAGKLFVYFLLGIVNNAFSKNYVLEEKNIKCLVFSVRKTARKQGSRRKNISYEFVNGLYIAELQCNDNHMIEKFIG